MEEKLIASLPVRCALRRGTVLLKDEELALDLTFGGQELL